jgi:diguanylate cyclase (GGDEF)-like protein/PAS domain S-box-containing protein
MARQEEIMVIDDTSIVLSLLRDILLLEGFQVRTANSGQSALDSIKAKSPDLILLDIRMPGLDGFEVCRRLKGQEETREIPIIFISALTDLEEKIKGFGLGAVDFITKPFQREEILARIQTHLELRHLRTHLEAQVAERTAQIGMLAEEIEDLYDNAPCGYHSLDEHGVFLRINNTALQWLGYTWNELIGKKKFSDLMAPKYRLTFLESLASFKTQGLLKDLELEIIRKDGSIFPVLLNASGIYDSRGQYLMIRSVMFDITELKQAEAALWKSEERYRNILETIEEGYYEVDIAGNFIFFNDSLCDLLGYSRDELMGLNSRQYTDEDSAVKLYHAFNKVYRTGVPEKSFDLKVFRKDGVVGFGEVSISPIQEGEKITGFRGIARDITERKKMEETIKNLSLKDELTGLYNRRGFFALAEQAMKTALRNGTEILLIYGDLDNLKGINDNLGHKEGDQALMDISRILKENFRESDIIARIGGDEFVILAMNDFENSAEVLPKRFEKALKNHNLKRSHSYPLSISLGIVTFDPLNPCSMDDLLASADKMMYANKQERQTSKMDLPYLVRFKSNS